MWPMKTATVRDLKHNMRKVTHWLSEGEEVELTRRGKPFARVVPHQQAPKPFQRPDFRSGLREIWGDVPAIPARKRKAFWDEFRADE